MIRPKNKGFTLIELLVVVAIISLLVSSAVTMFSTAQKRSRDARRLGDMNTIQKAMEVYINDHQVYPDENSANGGWEKSLKSDGEFLKPLTEGGYVNGEVPVDPTNSPPKYYAYYKFSAGSYGCDPNKGAFYVLGIRDTDTSRNPHPQSPGWTCPNRDFQNDFEWVIGGFEY